MLDSIDMKRLDKSGGKFDCTVSLFNETEESVEQVLGDTQLGKAFRVEKGHYLWDKDTEYKGKLPLFCRVVLKEKYTLCVTVIKRGALKGMIASKEFLK